MTAATTIDLKRVLGQYLAAASDSDNYYLAIGKSEPYQPGVGDTPPVQQDSDVSSISYERKARASLQSFKRATGIGFVIPRVDWVSGTTYVAYDDNVTTQPEKHYVLNSNNELFMCLETSRLPDGTTQASTQEPTSALANNSTKSFRLQETLGGNGTGYLWRYIAPLSLNDMNRYSTADYIPVKRVSDVVIPQDSDQLDLQLASAAGEILSLQIDSGGTGYTSEPVITISGNVPLGDSAAFFVIRNSGVITSIMVDSDGSGNPKHGRGYNNAIATITGGGGSGAVARVVMGPKEGLNANPVSSMRSRDFMITTNFDNDEGNSILAENDFRQALLIKDATVYNSSQIFTGNTANALTRLDLSGGVASTDFPEDATVTATNNSKAKVVFYDTTGPSIYIHQDDETGYGPFIGGQSITSNPGTGQATLGATPTIDPDVDIYSGEVLFIHNNIAVARSSTQTEDVKLIIKF